MAFHAVLDKEKITTSSEPVVCDAIVSNVGGAYSSETGIFTAPVAGSYCFMASASSCKMDEEKKCKMAIVVENDMKGFLVSGSTRWSTCHTAVWVKPGQRVWLRSYGDREYTFGGGWWTSFSGMLLQPAI